MPIFCQLSAQKTNGFSIDDIIKKDRSSTSSKRLSSPSPLSSPSSPSYVSPITWLPSQTTGIYQFQRESIFQYLRQNNQFNNPASMAAFFLNTYRKPKRNRTAFTPSQLLKLENAFEKNHYIVGQERKELAKHLNLPEARVKVWYQNRRTKHKRFINEDANSSTNEVDHQNELDTMIQHADKHLWSDEENDNHTDLIHEREKSYSN